MSDKLFDLSESLLKLAALPIVAGACFFSAFFWKMGASPVGIIAPTDVISFGITSLPEIGLYLVGLATFYALLDAIPINKFNRNIFTVFLRVLLFVCTILLVLSILITIESIPDEPSERVSGASRGAYILTLAYTLSFCISIVGYEFYKRRDRHLIFFIYVSIALIYGIRGLANGELQYSRAQMPNATICFDECTREELALVTSTHLLVRRDGRFVYLSNRELRSYSFDNNHSVKRISSS